MSEKSILYLGDTSLHGAACYLAGLMTSWGWGYDYVPSDQAVTIELLTVPRKLIVVSDYPARLLDDACQRIVAELVGDGTGLLMIGGWESFHGQGGDWHESRVGRMLPVHISAVDDRVNCDQPALIRHRHPHPTTQGLPWESRSPTIGGFNRLQPKPESAVLLDVYQMAAKWEFDHFILEPMERHPLLVVGQYGNGRTAALATDAAPHWVGGLVDWGTQRVAAQAPGAYAIEVGDLYAQFIKQLLGWTAKIEI